MRPEATESPTPEQAPHGHHRDHPQRPASSRTLFAAAARGTVINERLNRTKAPFSPRWVSAVSFSEMAAAEPTDVDRETVGAGVLEADTADRYLGHVLVPGQAHPTRQRKLTIPTPYEFVTPQILACPIRPVDTSEQLDAPLR